MKISSLVSLSLLLVLACVEAKAATITPIASIQGTSTRSPLLGQQVLIKGVVVAGFGKGLGGVFVEDLVPDKSGLAATGIFVAIAPGAIAPGKGDIVQVAGTVAELGDGGNSLTALIDTKIQSTASSKSAVSAHVLNAAPADWERYEGMLVKIAAPLTISGNEGLAQYGEISVSFGPRLFTPTEIAAPSAAARKVAADNQRRSLLLDDGRSSENPKDLWFLPNGLDDAHPLRAGSVLRGVEGVVDQRRGQYRLQLTDKLAAITPAPRPKAPNVAGSLRIASLNVLNMFNGDGKRGGFPTSRGAETFEQYQRQVKKQVAVVQALAPDVAALMEVENDGYGPESALAQFVAALNAGGAIKDYRFVDAGNGPGTNPIRVALIYRSSRVMPQGKPAVLEGGPFTDHSRVPLAQAFVPVAGQHKAFVIVANHLKSKGCGKGADAAKGDDADLHDGQSCWNATRVDSAQRIDAWLKTDPTQAHTDRQLLVGDFNAYALEDPLTRLRAAGWQDAFVVAKVPQPYSFVYDGLAGRLDHALLSATMAKQLRGAVEWHNNADESDFFDYHQDQDNDPYRASDHDPILLGFDLD